MASRLRLPVPPDGKRRTQHCAGSQEIRTSCVTQVDLGIEALAVLELPRPCKGDSRVSCIYLTYSPLFQE